MKHYIAINRTIGTVIEFDACGYKEAKRRLGRINRLNAQHLPDEPGRLEWMRKEERAEWMAKHPIR